MDLTEQILQAWRDSDVEDPELRVRNAVASVMQRSGRVTPEEEQQLQQIWQYWTTVMGYPHMTKRAMGVSRRKYALTRLREGRTVEEFQLILDWCAADPFMRGKNAQARAYDDFDTLFSSAAKFEKYLKHALTPKRTATVQSALQFDPSKQTSFL